MVTTEALASLFCDTKTRGVHWMNGHRFLPPMQIGLLFLFLISLLLAACEFTPRDPHEVIYWTADVGDISIKAENAIVAAFNKANPDVHVKLVPLPGGSDTTTLLTAVRGGTGPDVYYIDRFTVSQQAAIGLLQDLKPFIDKEGVDLGKNYLPFAWDETLYRNHPYALPLHTDARGLYYNKDVFRAAGIDPDIMDPSHGPITIDQLRDISFKINKLNSRGTFDRIGFVPWMDQASHTTWGIDFGAKFFDPKTCQVTPTEPAMERALQFQYDWATKLTREKVDTFFATYQPENAPPTQNPFYSGNLAMTLSGNWMIASLQEYAPKVDYGITYIPVEKAGDKPSTWSGGFALVMPTGAHNPTGAYRFMRFMTGEEGQRIYDKATTQLPTWASLLNESDLFPGKMQFFKQILPFSKSRVPLPVGSQLWDQFTDAQDKVVLHAATPEQALQTVYRRVQPELQQYCPL
jgi:ABC-type glycerol-3-phosphate transport system substrate-binding protein